MVLCVHHLSQVFFHYFYLPFSLFYLSYLPSFPLVVTILLSVYKLLLFYLIPLLFSPSPRNPFPSDSCVSLFLVSINLFLFCWFAAIMLCDLKSQELEISCRMNFVFPQNPYVETLILKMMAFRGRGSLGTK